MLHQRRMGPRSTGNEKWQSAAAWLNPDNCCGVWASRTACQVKARLAPALIPDHMLKFHISAAQRKGRKSETDRPVSEVVGVSALSITREVRVGSRVRQHGSI